MNASAPAMMDLPAQDALPEQDLMHVLQQHRASLRNFLRKRLRSDEEVDDALQETSLRLFHYHSRHAVDSPAALLYHVAERVAADFSRRAQSRQAGAHCTLDEIELASDEPSPEQLASAEQDLTQLVNALERLSPRCQDVFVLSRMEGLSYPQIAMRCGISVKMVEKYMSRALAGLRARVGDWRDAAT